jgi:PKD repeat protein
MLFPAAASATWFDAGWKYRRPIDVTLDADTVQGSELATVEFYTAGHCKPNGEDIRIATDEGRPVAMRVLMMGPGDKASVVFTLAKRVSRYYVYFGNDTPPPPRPELADVKYQSRLLLDMKAMSGHPNLENAQGLQETWEKSPDTIGRTFISNPLLGINPLGPQDRTISKIVGSLSVQADGDYAFAMAVHARAGLFLDGKPVLFAIDGPSDVRFQVNLPLTKGRHEFVLYHANVGGDGRFLVAWKMPGKAAFEPISPLFFGAMPRTAAGPLEEIRRDWVADFAVEYGAECFFADHYSHRFKFFAHGPLKNVKLQLKWDFGDGQTSTVAEPEHVYLTDGIYPVTVSMRIGTIADSQTSKLSVGRNWSHIDNPTTDEPPKQSAIVSTYDVSRMPDDWLPWATLLMQRSGKFDAMFVAATRVVSIPRHPDLNAALFALRDATESAEKNGKSADMASVLEKAPPISDLQPRAVLELARLLVWRIGDFVHAVQVLQPYVAQGDADLKRVYGQALVLSGKPDEGRKILGQVAPTGNPTRQAALSGAQARTIEFYITQKDPESGEKAWQKWQQLYPDDFLEGYSAVLQTRLMELQNVPQAAAKVAEAFANAVPASSYAPQLLDRASKLVATSDPGKSDALHKLLKDRYPEDPLSQN